MVLIEPEFHVLQAYGPKQDECIQQATSMAKCTGSTGATHSIARNGEVHSMARVERPREKTFHSDVTIEEKG